LGSSLPPSSLLEPPRTPRKSPWRREEGSSPYPRRRGPYPWRREDEGARDPDL
jgi:hypothetical protein